ncbi:MAG: tetratricopeptide repeat protein [Pseudomonadota bacterium]|nr:tetratricopeptide repeat protein [Pseudomonadota bacterium]
MNNFFFRFSLVLFIFPVLALAEGEYQCKDRHECISIEKQLFDAKAYTESAKGTLPDSFIEVQRQLQGITSGMIDDERDEEAPKRLFGLASKIYIDLCDKPIAKACHLLGQFYEKGYGMKPNITEASKLYNKSCRLGEVEACTSLAKNIKDSENPELNKAAMALFQEGCFRNEYDTKSCYKFAQMNIKKAGSIKKTIKALNQSCLDGSWRGYSPACLTLSEMYEKGTGVQQDSKKAFILAESVCMLSQEGVEKPCRSLSRMYEKGIGVMKDPFIGQRYVIKDDGDGGRLKEITTLFEKSCEIGNEISCRNAAISYIRGFGVDKNPDRALELMSRSCELHDEQACSMKERILQ